MALLTDTTPDARLVARRIVTVIQNHRISVATERAAHDAIEAALVADGMEVEREVDLGRGNGRIDLRVGRVGIEVKIAGGRRNIYDQLTLYAQSGAADALVLATSGAWPASCTEIEGLPLSIASLSAGWL